MRAQLAENPAFRPGAWAWAKLGGFHRRSAGTEISAGEQSARTAHRKQERLTLTETIGIRVFHTDILPLAKSRFSFFLFYLFIYFPPSLKNGTSWIENAWRVPEAGEEEGKTKAVFRLILSLGRDNQPACRKWISMVFLARFLDARQFYNWHWINTFFFLQNSGVTTWCRQLILQHLRAYLTQIACFARDKVSSWLWIESRPKLCRTLTAKTVDPWVGCPQGII